jgi:hypothetical protein
VDMSNTDMELAPLNSFNYKQQRRDYNISFRVENVLNVCSFCFSCSILLSQENKSYLVDSTSRSVWIPPKCVAAYGGALQECCMQRDGYATRIVLDLPIASIVSVPQFRCKTHRSTITHLHGQCQVRADRCVC